MKKKFEQLSDGYLFGRVHRMDFIKPHLEIGRKIWLSVDGASKNFQLIAADLIGNKIYLQYMLEQVDLTSTKKGAYLTVVPLKENYKSFSRNDKERPQDTCDTQ